MKPYIMAGVSSGIAGLLVFLIIHHIWIMPIWFILPLGIPIAALGGLAVAWSYCELRPHLPPRPWTSFALMALMGLILLPSILFAELRDPMFDVSIPGGQLNLSVRGAIGVFILELLVPAVLAGGLVGWLLGHSPQAVLSTALAGFIFALGPGHNIPFLGGTPGNLEGIALLSAILFTSSIVLVEMHAWAAVKFKGMGNQQMADMDRHWQG